MKFLGNVDLLGNKLKSAALENLNEYPVNPTVGSFSMIQKRLMLCIDTGNDAQNPLPMWMPMSSEVQMFKHSQSQSASTWVVEHNLNDATPVFQIYDAAGNIFTPDEVVIVDANTLSISLLAAMTGSVTVLSGTQFGSPALTPVKTQVYAAATSWNMVHNLGRVPGVRVYVSGAEVQANVTADANTVTVDFGTNSVAGTLLLF